MHHVASRAPETPQRRDGEVGIHSHIYEEEIYEELAHMVTHRTAQGGEINGEGSVHVDEVGDQKHKVNARCIGDTTWAVLAAYIVSTCARYQYM